MTEEDLLWLHASQFRNKTGYGIANVHGELQKGNLKDARALLNELMALNYMADNGYAQRQ